MSEPVDVRYSVSQHTCLAAAWTSKQDEWSFNIASSLKLNLVFAEGLV